MEPRGIDMARQAVTPSDEAYCSSCLAKVTRDMPKCPKCGEMFSGTVDAGLCGSCQAPVTMDSSKCTKCGNEFAPVKTADGIKETEYLRRMLHWRSLPGIFQKSDSSSLKTQSENLAPERVEQQEPVLPPEAARTLYQMSEPLEKVLKMRKQRLKNVDSLIVEARRRIEILERSSDPVQQSERQRLMRWVSETLAEREDLETIEKSIFEMDRTYKNVLTLQQIELKNKQESLNLKLESMQIELARMQREKLQIREKEEEIARKEEELRKILAKISDKEAELAALELTLKEKADEAEQQRMRLKESEVQLEKDRWMAEQRNIQAQLVAMKTGGVILQPGTNIADEMLGRIGELEGQLEKLDEERKKVGKEADDLKMLLSDFSKVMKIIDDLLGQLPLEVVRKFAKSPEFGLYENVLQRCGV